MLASSSLDGKICLWNTQTGELKKAIEDCDLAVTLSKFATSLFASLSPLAGTIGYWNIYRVSQKIFYHEQCTGIGFLNENILFSSGRGKGSGLFDIRNKYFH